MAPGILWSPWRPLLDYDGAFSADGFRETLDGGQTFTWDLLDPASDSTLAPDSIAYEGIWGQHLMRLSWRNGRISWTLPTEAPVTPGRRALDFYLGLDLDWDRIASDLPWRSDHVLHRMMIRLRGLRILRQPVNEVLLMFLCSSTKRIPQIKQIGATMAERFGDPLPTGRRTLPSWERLASIGEEPLRRCRLGYRAGYIAACAKIIAKNPGFLDRLNGEPTREARRILMELPGVGRKIADCTLLFGLGRLDVFPIDTWIHKTLTSLYRLDGWELDHLQEFARIHFGPYSGLAQQFLFSGARQKRLTL